MQQDAARAGTSAYIYAVGTAPAEQVNLSAGTITYLINDSLGSVRGAVTSSGTLSGSATYDAWGNPLTAGGLTATTPYGYAGSYTDTTGLTYNLNRYYDPSVGLFISVDPDLADTLEPYVYAGDNPVSYADPTGLYRGIEYRPQCTVIGCVNIVKFCMDNLKNCALYWNTSVEPAYKSATGATLYVTIQVQQRNVTSYAYNKAKNANSLPFFHGNWGFGVPMGKYSYPCWVFATCTGWLKASDDVEFGGVGTWYRNGLKAITIYGRWGVNTGRDVPWTGGGQKWARLPYLPSLGRAHLEIGDR